MSFRDELWRALTAFDEAWMQHIATLNLPADMRAKHEDLGNAIANYMAQCDIMERHTRMLTAMLNAAIAHGVEVVDLPEEKPSQQTELYPVGSIMGAATAN
jgi:hypothetical protein